MRTLPLFAIALGLTVGFVLPAFFPSLRGSSQAGTALRLSLEDTFERSDVVVEGRVHSATSGEDAEGLIYTDWVLRADRSYWGEVGETFTVRLPGGVLSTGKGMVVPGMPRLTVGEDVVLFLGEESPMGMRLPTGLSQGKFRIVTSTSGDRTAIQTGEHVSLITARNTRTADGLDMLDYADLVARLEAMRQDRLTREVPPILVDREPAGGAATGVK